MHKNITLTGRVQNVGFRFSARSVARSMQVKGFVRNRSDGTVYIEAEGRPQQLQKFINWCSEGPRSAIVENILVEDGETKDFKTFNIA